MDPLGHAAYLREMGIDWYLARRPLAVKALPHVLLVPVSAAAVEPVAQPPVQVSVQTRQKRPDIDISTPASNINRVLKATPPEVISAEVVAPQAKVDESFHLMVVSYQQSLVFACEIKASPLSPVWEQSARQFMDDVVRAIGLDTHLDLGAQLEYFSWPPAKAPTGRSRTHQAKEWLGGFMSERMTRCKPKALVLLGDLAQRQCGAAIAKNEVIVIISAPSLGQLFTRPAQKAELWAELQVLL
ncbi:MAG: hypothetical protein V7711_16285 [Pseudomonadales bacterium]